MDWRDHIIVDPDILCGKPTLKGTRLSVEFVLDLLAAGWEMPALRLHYPNLTEERIRAVHAYVADILKNERFYLLPPFTKSARANVIWRMRIFRRASSNGSAVRGMMSFMPLKPWRVSPGPAATKSLLR
jgi:uncharacterized protein (DUF433 family)